MGLPRPEGQHSITPGFRCNEAAKVLDFLETAFGARVVECYDISGGGIAHVEVMIDDSVVMFGDPEPGSPPMPALVVRA